MRYAVRVRYAQERTVMVDATTPQKAAQLAEEVALKWENTVAARAINATQATPETLRQSRRKG